MRRCSAAAGSLPQGWAWCRSNWYRREDVARPHQQTGRRISPPIARHRRPDRIAPVQSAGGVAVDRALKDQSGDERGRVASRWSPDLDPGPFSPAPTTTGCVCEALFMPFFLPHMKCPAGTRQINNSQKAFSRRNSFRRAKRSLASRRHKKMATWRET